MRIPYRLGELRFPHKTWAMLLSALLCTNLWAHVFRRISSRYIRLYSRGLPSEYGSRRQYGGPNPSSWEPPMQRTNTVRQARSCRGSAAELVIHPTWALWTGLPWL